MSPPRENPCHCCPLADVLRLPLILVREQFVDAEKVLAGILAEIFDEERAVALAARLIHEILLTLRREDADSACSEASATVVVLK